MSMKSTTKLAIVFLIGSFLGGSAFADKDIVDKKDLNKEKAYSNAISFHMTDFMGWNNRDYDVLRHYHTKDVKVRAGGRWTTGIDEHMEFLKQIFEKMPNSYITQHAPIVLGNDWNCTIGVSATMGNYKMATVARYRDGAISEEYLFTTQTDGLPKFIAPPIVNLVNRDRSLKSQVGAEPGWRCTMGQTADGKYAVTFSRDENGRRSELSFQE